jgi:hypothetical protein
VNTDAAADTALTLTPKDVAKRLKVRRDVAVMFMQTGRLRAENTGMGKNAYWRTSEAWLDAYLRGQTVGNNTRNSTDYSESTGDVATNQAG